MAKPPSPKPGKKPRKNYIELPEDFDAPDVEKGETFEAVAEIRKDKDGYCVVSLDGVPLKEDKPDDEPDDEEETLGAGARRMMEGDY